MIATRNLLLVALGSAIGGCLRFALRDLSLAWGPLAFPWDTLFVNASGSLLMGWFATISDPLSSPRGRFNVSAPGRDFVMAGMLGGYTTFSIFSLETMLLIEAAEHGKALINILGSMLTCLLAVWAGHSLARSMNHRFAAGP